MEGTQPDKPVVLYVDDISANLMLFEASFEQYFDVILAPSGDEGLRILRERDDIAVIVSDQNMPGLSGNELLEIVTEEFPFIMRFMITAYTDYSTVVDAVNKGQIYGFFNKPYNVDEVRMSIERSLEVRDLRLRNQEMIEHLAMLNEQLLSTDRTKTNFLKTISNEIRKPINRITTVIHMLKDKIDSRELTEMLHLLDFSVSRLESFTYAADQLVKLRNTDFSIQAAPVSLREVIDIAVIEKKQLLSDEKLTFSLQDNTEQPVVDGELDLLVVCFNAMLDYCATHSEQEAELVFRLERSNGRITQSIINNHCHIPEPQLEVLQQYFSGPDISIEEQVPLELVLVQQIMQVHNGSIELVTHEDKNLEFSMIFPGKKASD